MSPIVMALPIQPFRVVSYAKGIYVYGTNRLTARDGKAGVAEGYYTPVEVYAATGLVNGVPYSASFTGYTDEQLDLALASGWITQTEYDETLTFRV